MKDLFTESVKTSLRVVSSIDISLVINESIVAIFGWIIPDPFATPATVTSVPSWSKDTAISFVLLSVVKIDLANPGPSFLESSILGIYFLIRAIGSSTPMIPVDATAIESRSIDREFDTILAVSLASIYPWFPTAQLAQPEFTTTALSFFSLRTSLVQVTEGETTEFWVNVPALTHSVSEKIIPISLLSCPGDLIPANIDPDKNPFGEQISPFFMCLISFSIKTPSN